MKLFLIILCIINVISAAINLLNGEYFFFAFNIFLLYINNISLNNYNNEGSNEK